MLPSSPPLSPGACAAPHVLGERDRVELLCRGGWRCTALGGTGPRGRSSSPPRACRARAIGDPTATIP
eukprot:7416319-Alexandrium_andersonii.AAC.1